MKYNWQTQIIETTLFRRINIFNILGKNHTTKAQTKSTCSIYQLSM